MIIDVIITVSEGKDGPYFPPQIPPRLCYGKSYPYSRINEVVNLIKEEGLKNKYPILKTNLNSIKENTIYTLTGSNSDEFFYTRKGDERKTVVYKLCKVSTSLPWTIVCDDCGRERIEYFNKNDNYVIVDKELNYAQEQEMDK